VARHDHPDRGDRNSGRVRVCDKLGGSIRRIE
jgi:hypothetical protein